VGALRLTTVDLDRRGKRSQIPASGAKKEKINEKNRGVTNERVYEGSNRHEESTYLERDDPSSILKEKGVNGGQKNRVRRRKWKRQMWSLCEGKGRKG